MFRVKNMAGSSPRRQAGMMLMEMLISLGIMSGIYVGVSQTLDIYTERTRQAGIAQHAIVFREAVEKYTTDNYSAILAVATAGQPALIRTSTLSGAGYLDAGYSAVNGLRQTICALAIQPTAGRLQVLVVTEGGTAINDVDLGMVAAQIPQGGGIYASAPTVFRGAMGSYSVPFGAFASGNNAGVRCDGATAGAVSLSAGHLVSALWFANGDKTAGLLYRNDMSAMGQPQLNQMNTPLVMASVQTSGAACGTLGAIARDSTGTLLVCPSTGTWKSPSSATSWKDPVANFASLPGAGNTVGDVRIAKDTARPYMWTGGGWAATAVDQNGDLNVPNTLRAAGGRVVAWNQVSEGGVLEMTGANGVRMYLENNNGSFRLVNHPWNAQLFAVDQGGNVSAIGNISGGNFQAGGNVSANADVTGAGSIRSGKYLRQDWVVLSGWGCGEGNGAIAHDPDGALMSCQNGVWRNASLGVGTRSLLKPSAGFYGACGTSGQWWVVHEIWILGDGTPEVRDSAGGYWIGQTSGGWNPGLELTFSVTPTGFSAKQTWWQDDGMGGYWASANCAINFPL